MHFTTKFLLESLNPRSCAASSMTDDSAASEVKRRISLNPRSCAASSMTEGSVISLGHHGPSQSAFVRGFIDDLPGWPAEGGVHVSIRVRARLHR